MLNFIMTYWDECLAFIGALVSFATLVVKATPSVKDDSILEKIIAFLRRFSILKS